MTNPMRTIGSRRRSARRSDPLVPVSHELDHSCAGDGSPILSWRPMRVLSLLVSSSLLLACQRPIEVRGLYVHDHEGNLVPCDLPTTIWHVSDATLAARYGLNATSPYQRLFVRRRGIREDSGSIYYSRHYFLVDQILEIRPTRTGECPSAAASLSSVMR